MASDDIKKQGPPAPPGQANPGANRNYPNRNKLFDASRAAAPSQGLRNAEFFKIKIKHLATGRKTAFEAWVTEFSDTYSAQWNEELVYGRMDPLSTFQGTRRTISLRFDIPNDSAIHAEYNMQQIQKMIQFMYPVYEKGDGLQSTLSAAPLLTLKWTNLISSPTSESGELVGYINGDISYAPDIGEGGFMGRDVVKWETNKDPEKLRERAIRGHDMGAGDKKGITNYYPKKVSLGFTFSVLHTHLVGWMDASTDNGKAGDEKEVTKMFVFGDDDDVAKTFPNLSLPNEMPADLAAARKEAVEAAATERARLIEEGPNRLQYQTPGERRIEVDENGRALNQRQQQRLDNATIRGENIRQRRQDRYVNRQIKRGNLSWDE